MTEPKHLILEAYYEFPQKARWRPFVFPIKKAPVKPLVSASKTFIKPGYHYQVDIALYIPKSIQKVSLKNWTPEGEPQYISHCHDPNKSENITTAYRHITVELPGFDSAKLKKLLSEMQIPFHLYVAQIGYVTAEEDPAKSIFVDFSFGDPRTSRGTVTTVRDIEENQFR